MLAFPSSVKVCDVQVELDELERSWAAGELKGLRKTVLRFVADKKSVLKEHSEVPLTLRVQNLIMDYVSLDIQSELKDQADEISKELWYAGERGHHTPDEIKSDWIFNHAENWRSWRVKEYLYVAWKSEAEIAKMLG